MNSFASQLLLLINHPCPIKSLHYVRPLTQLQKNCLIVESFEHPATIEHPATLEHLVAGLQITNTDLLPNYALRHAIGRWADGHNIKLPDPIPIPILAQKKVTPTQRLLEWGQCLPDATSPVAKAVGRLYRGNSQEQVRTV